MITKEQLAKAKDAATFNQATLDAWVDTAKRLYDSTEDFICTHPKEWALTIQTKVDEGYRVAEEFFPIIHVPYYYSVRMTKPAEAQAKELEQIVIEATASYYSAIETEKEHYAVMCGEYAVQESRKEAEEKQVQKEAKLREQAIKLALELKSL